MIKILDLPLQEDLTEFTQFLWQHQIPHRVVEDDQGQQLWVARTVDAQQILTIYEMWRQGQDLSRLRPVYRQASRATVSGSISRCWLCLLLIGTSIMLSLSSGFGNNFALLHHLTIADVSLQGQHLFTDGLAGTFSSFELWRLLTPIFLHFNLPHLLFNLLWVWVVGSRIELRQGPRVLALLVLFSGVFSNLAQYFDSGPMFGGMSGVVFALLGYSWLWDRLYPARPLGLPPALMGLMLVWLALGYAGVLESLGFGAIANTAHLAGLVAGLIFVPLGGMLARRGQSS